MKKNKVNLDEVAERPYGVKFQEMGISYTNTAMFVLPMLNLSIVRLGKYFLNCFIKDKEYPTLVERPLFLLFKFDYETKNDELHCKNIHDELTSKDELVTYYYVGNIQGSKCIMYLFNIDSEFQDDYNNFLKGKYSKFRPEFKEKFPKYFMDSRTGRQSKTIMSQVVNAAPELRKYWEDKIGVTLAEDAEVWTSPYLDEIETL